MARTARAFRAESGRTGGGDDEGVRGRVPPSDLDAEKAVLSALLIDNQVIHTVYTELKPDDFYSKRHEIIYQAMVDLREANTPIDLHTLREHLETQKQLEAVGGFVTLAELADYEATAANVLHYARIVRDKAIKRGLIAVATEIVELGFDQSDRADRLLDVAESKIFDISKARSRTTFRSLHQELVDAHDHIEAMLHHGGELTGLPTGFKELDDMTGGLQPGELIIIAARPGMGKTALALNIARNAAVDHAKKAAVFSLEMTSRALVMRLLSAEARIDFSQFRKGYGAVNDLQRLIKVSDHLSHADIAIDDGGELTLLELKAKCRRRKAERGLDLVIVDYLQLVKGETRSDRKDLEIAEVSRGLKALSKELHIPVIALSQLNRGPEQRDPDKRRPRLADLRESGAIEQDADLIAFIYRDEVYNKETAKPGIAELIIEKQRNGPTGMIDLTFEARYARFDNHSSRQDEPYGPRGGEGRFDPGPAAGSEEDPF